MKAQIGIEIMGILGFTFLILIPLFTGFYVYSNIFWERLAIEKADMAATRMASMVDMVGPQGEAMLVQEIVMPENVRAIKTQGNEVVLLLETSSGNTEIVKYTSYRINGNLGALPKGSYYIKAEAIDGSVKLELGQ